MIKWVVIGVLGLIILSYMGIDVRKTIESPVTQTNIEYIKESASYIWEKYLATPIGYLWNEIFIDLIWDPLIEKLKGNRMEEMKLNTE